MTKTFLILLYGVLLSLLAPPLFNWDIIGYTGAAHHADGLRGEVLRNTVYDEIQTVSSPETFKTLTLSDPYRKTVFTSTQALEEHIPFYSIRMAYIFTIRWTSAVFSIPYAQSTYILSAFFAGICVLFLSALVPLKSFLILLFFPIILFLAGFFELASLSSPDSMAAAIALLVMLTYQRYFYVALTYLAILPWIRTDYVILGGLLGFLAASDRNFRKAFLYIAIPTASYLLVNKLNSNYGYLKIFNFTLIEINPHPATMPIEKSIWPYLTAYGRGFSTFIGHKHFLIFLTYFIIWFRYYRAQRNRIINEQVFLVLGFVLLHMLLFPAYYQRFFAWCAAIAGLQAVSWIYEIKKVTHNPPHPK